MLTVFDTCLFIKLYTPSRKPQNNASICTFFLISLLTNTQLLIENVLSSQTFIYRVIYQQAHFTFFNISVKIFTEVSHSLLPRALININVLNVFIYEMNTNSQEITYSRFPFAKKHPHAFLCKTLFSLLSLPFYQHAPAIYYVNVSFQSVVRG